MVLLYGHFGPNDALNVFVELSFGFSDRDKASCALFNFLVNASQLMFEFLKSERTES